MNHFKSIVAVHVVCLLSAVAQADVTFWLEFDSSDANVTVLDQGPGRVLRVSDPQTTEPFTISTRMMISVTDFGLIGTSTHLTADFGAAVSSLAITQVPDWLQTSGVGVGNYGPGGIALNFSSTAFIFGQPILGDSVLFGTVSFTIDPQRGDYRLGEISASTGVSGWGYTDGEDLVFSQIRFGAGEFAPSGLGNSGTSPVLQIMPEPASISLILPVLFIVYRRRHCA